MTIASLETLGLPTPVLARVKHRMAEDYCLTILRRGLPDVPSYSLIPPAVPPIFLLIRSVPEIGDYGTRRGISPHEFDFAVHIYAEDPDGDEKAGIVGDAVVDVFEQAYHQHWDLGPDMGTVNKIVCRQYPARETDWATSVGPVQYADLPTGDWRYEARFRARINPPR